VKSTEHRDLSIVLAGEAGQGVQTIEHALIHVLKSAGFYVYSTGEFMSRIRGGTNSTEVRVSSRPVNCFVNRIDLLIPLSGGALKHLSGRICPETVVIGEKSVAGDDPRIEDVGFTRIAVEAGGKLFANTVAVAVVLSLLRVEPELLSAYLTARFSRKEPEVLQRNLDAAQRGAGEGVRLRDTVGAKIVSPSRGGSPDDLVLDGSEAVALGAIAGGCNFVCAYPMSPGTGVLQSMASHAHDFDMVVEQVEDEIAAINMALGSWYAGGRALVTTAGGGFSLMCEGMSLAGMIETPVVVLVGQRPGPATGLPTRTEQGDLELAVYAGHGDFPRAIYAPGTLQQAFDLARTAFVVADKYQVPAIILGDQSFLDSHAQTPAFDLSADPVKQYVVASKSDYVRYAITPSGISPRAIPGWGDGIVAVDSDEHTEAGYITESMDVRSAMVEKRLRKAASLMAEVLPPTLVGPEAYENLVVCWGSTYHVVKESLDELGRSDTAMLHFSQVYPVHPSALGLISCAKRTVIVENNATAQLARLLKLHANVDITRRLLKYSGMPFAVEEVVAGLMRELS